MKLIYIALILLVASLWVTEASYYCSKYSYRRCYYPTKWNSRYCKCCPYKCSYGYYVSGCKCIRRVCSKRCSYGYYLDYSRCWCRRKHTVSCCKSRYGYRYYSYCNRYHTKYACNYYYKTKGCYWGCNYHG